MLALLMALSKFYGDDKNGAGGARAGIAFIFLYSGLYAVFFNSTLYTVAAETFPQHLRGYGTSIAAFCQNVTAIWLGQVTPYAFDAISWKYYAVFISSLVILSAFYAIFLTETNQLTLESIAGKFGDDTISTDKVVGVMTEHAEAEADKNAAGTAKERMEVA
jgi:MFS family permease